MEPPNLRSKQLQTIKLRPQMMPPRPLRQFCKLISLHQLWAWVFPIWAPPLSSFGRYQQPSTKSVTGNKSKMRQKHSQSKTTLENRPRKPDSRARAARPAALPMMKAVKIWT